jgi:predicted RNA-binding protein with PUA-like domain
MWLLKTEPGTYSYDDLMRDGRAVWDGVKNPAALRNMGEMKVGDAVAIYHTGNEKAVVGLAEVTRAAYPDPKLKAPRLLVVDLKPGARFARAVTLAEIRGMAEYDGSPLVRQGRLSVVPITAPQWKVLLARGRQ